MTASQQVITNNRYQIIPRALVFAMRQDAVLLIKGAPDKKIWPNLYNGVGGHIEQGEDPLSAARREFREETGLELRHPWLCAVATIDTGGPVGIGMFVFRGEVGQGQLKASAEGELAWVPQHELYDLPLVEDLPELLPRVLAMQPGQPPLMAQYVYDSTGKLIVRFA